MPTSGLLEGWLRTYALVGAPRRFVAMPVASRTRRTPTLVGGRTGLRWGFMSFERPDPSRAVGADRWLDLDPLPEFHLVVCPDERTLSSDEISRLLAYYCGQAGAED